MTGELFVPGRLCLLGEHSDWAARYRSTHPGIAPGHCLVAGTDQGLFGDPEPADGALAVRFVGASGERIDSVRLPLGERALDAAARRDGFFRYVAGAAAEVHARHEVGGLALRIRSDLPVRRGLSSSAAVCVLTARAYSLVYGLGLGPEQEMDVAYAGERRTGSECGRMDPVCALGRVLTALRFDGDDFAVERIVPGGDFHWVVVDLGWGKDTRRILADLNACFPDAPGPVAAGVRDALGARSAERVAQARSALESGDAPAMGALMDEAQADFDAHLAPACAELRAPHLHALLAHPAVGELGLGAKGVGSGGDGCAQILARGPGEQRALSERLRDELGLDCYPLHLGPA